MIISLAELVDMLVMTLFVGFIFKDALGMYAPRDEDPLHYYTQGYGHKGKGHAGGRLFGSSFSGHGWGSFYFAVLVTVPGIVLHELGHKFVALGFGMNAVFHAAYTWLIIGVLLKLMSFGLIFFVPGYVSIAGSGTPLQYAAIAFAGPGVNLLLWLASYLLLKYNLVAKRYVPIVVLTRKINLFLFVFNMLPIPPFDGFSVFSNLARAFF
jgi:Zn-dependent protease